MRIYKDPSKIKQLLMTSFPVENEDESKTFSVWLKLLSWTFNCNNQICIILFLLGSGITGLRPCFQFSNWKKSTKTDSNWASKSCSIPSRVRRIRWACPFFPTEKFGRSSKLKLKATNEVQVFSSSSSLFLPLRVGRKDSDIPVYSASSYISFAMGLIHSL